MNQDQFEGKWKQFKGTVKSELGKLTDDDLKQAEGSYESLVGRVQERYGKSKEEAEKTIDKILS